MTIKHTKTFGVGALICAGLLITFTQAALAADPIAEVAAPCQTTADPNLKGLKTCDQLLQTKVKEDPGQLEQLQELARLAVNNLSLKPGAAGIQPCALVPNPLVTLRGEREQPPYTEDRINRFGKSCGQSMYIKVRSSPIRLEFHKTYPQGSLEDGWFTGSQMQAIAFYLNEVQTEIGRSKKLSIKNPTGGTSYCQAAASDYQNLFTARKKLVELATANPQNANLLKQMFDCSQKKEDPTTAGTNFTYGQHSSDLCANRNALEAAFLNLASCEVNARADSSYLAKIGSQQALTDTYSWLRETLKMTCKSCMNESCANQCYQRNIGTKVAEHLKAIWPISVPTAQTASREIDWVPEQQFELAGLLFGLSLVRKRARKKVAVKARRPRVARIARPKVEKAPTYAVVTGYRRLLRLFGVASSFAVVSLLVSGCFGGGGVDENTPTSIVAQGARCPWGMPQFKVECCTADGQLNTEICTDPNTLASEAVTTALGNTADNLDSGSLSLHGASELLGVDPSQLDLTGGMDGGGTLSNTSAALASTGGGTSIGGINSANGYGALSNGSRAPQNPSGDGGTIANSAGDRSPASGVDTASTPSMFGSNTASNSPAPGGGGAAPGTDSGAAALGTTPSSGGKGGLPAAGGTQYAALGTGVFGAGAGNGQDGGTVAFGGLGAADRGPAGAGDQAFSGSQGPNPVGSEDPSDYFTRVGMDDSLFKIVTRRYRERASAWALTSMTKAGGSQR
jgi:hypothetical protein